MAFWTNLAAALALLLVLRPGTELGGDLAARQAYVVDNLALWRIGWALWIAAALGLLLFYAWWSTRIPSGVIAAVAMGVAIAGFVFDLTAETLLIAWVPDRYAELAPTAFFLTGVPANGLYTLAGALLTLRTRGLRGAIAVLAWATWASGAALSLFAALGLTLAAAVATGVLFALFLPWCLVLRRRLG